MRKIYPLEKIKKLPKSYLNKIILEMKRSLKTNKIMIGIFKDYGVDIEELEFIPMSFMDLDVSAQCNHGIIYLNYKLLCDGSFKKDYGYAIHEITHWLQQTSGDKPTQSSDDGDYLSNEFEIEGFQNQIEYMGNEFGEEEAENYVDHLLDHHKVKDPNYKRKKKEVLLSKL